MIKIKNFLRCLFGVPCGILQLVENVNKLNKIMSSLETLTLAVADLTTAVDSAVTALNAPHPTDAQVLAAADAVASQTARLNAALGIVVPTV